MTKNIFALIELICLEALVSTQVTNQNVQTMFVLKDKKYPKMVMVWIAISRSGSPSVNSTIYIECLEKSLLPFIQEHHADSNYIFCSDLAGAHYSGLTEKWYHENVNFVTKHLNPPNVPQARPKEICWGCLAQKVYDRGWQAKTEDQLINRIKSKLKEFDSSYVESLMKGVKAKVKSIGQNGVYSLYKK